MIKTIEREGITLTLTLNPDESVDINTMMQATYPLSDGSLKEAEMYPVPCDGFKHYGTITAQFDYVKTVQKFDNTVLARGVNPHVPS